MNFFSELKRRNVYKVAVAAAEKPGARQAGNQFVNCGLRSLYAYCVMHDA